MYCDIIKEMPNRRLKIKVYGDRHVSICGEKIRYVDAHRVVDAKDYNVKKILNDIKYEMKYSQGNKKA